jgi:hypothetical protein
MPTPNGTNIIAENKEFDEDVTEAVQALYDLIIQSLDWGSGFISAEEAEPIARLAQLCGFERWEEAERYLDHKRKLEAYVDRDLGHEEV